MANRISSRCLLLLALAGSIAGCYQKSFDPSSIAKQDKLSKQETEQQAKPNVDPELEKILASIQEDPGNQDLYIQLEKWLDQNLVEGETTQAEFMSGFGKQNLTDLDRPDRDNIITLQWLKEYDGSANLCGVVFQFDAQTGKFLRRDITFSICGYCPHILANDGSWHLEGKLLAGCVGLAQEGWDTLLLPRLTPQNESLQIEIYNPAPEIEFIDQVQLGVVQLSEDEELDVAYDGTPVIWRAIREVECSLAALPTNQEVYTLNLDSAATGRVLVLEVSNTSRFEQAMRDSVLSGSKKSGCPSMIVHCDDGTDFAVEPVGTKFLRRVVVPVPNTAKSVQIEASSGLWFMRRCWVGVSRSSEASVRWKSLSQAKGPNHNVKAHLLAVDEKRLRLEPGEKANLCFAKDQAETQNARSGYLLRMRGYYDFIENISNHE